MFPHGLLYRLTSDLVKTINHRGSIGERTGCSSCAITIGVYLLGVLRVEMAVNNIVTIGKGLPTLRVGSVTRGIGYRVLLL